MPPGASAANGRCGATACTSSTSNDFETGWFRAQPLGHQSRVCSTCRRRQAAAPAQPESAGPAAQQLPGGQPQPEDLLAHRKGSKPLIKHRQESGSTPRASRKADRGGGTHSRRLGYWIHGPSPSAEGAAFRATASSRCPGHSGEGGKGGGRIDADVGGVEHLSRMLGQATRGLMENGGKAGAAADATATRRVEPRSAGIGRFLGPARQPI